MPIVPIPRERITVNYISPTMGLVTNITIEEANAYEKNNHDSSLAIFAKYFSEGSEDDILKVGGEKVEEQTVRTILSNKNLSEAVEIINLPLLLLARKSKIRRKI